MIKLNNIYIQQMKKANYWSPHEDQAFQDIFFNQRIQKWKQYGIKKTPKQCRQRFKNHLNPQISKEHWSSHEIHYLLQLHQQMGNRWADISRRLPGRNDNCVKNKLYSLYRHAISNINNILRRNRNSRFKQITMSFIIKLIALIDSKFKSNDHFAEEIISQADALKNTIIQFLDISEAQVNDFQPKLAQIMAKIHFINSQFKKKAVRIPKRKSSSYNNSSQLPKESKMPTEHPQEVIQQEKKQKNSQVLTPEAPEESCIFVIPLMIDRIYIRSPTSNEEDIWEEGCKSEDSQIWIGNRYDLNRYEKQL